MQHTIRAVTPDDVPFLWEMLYYAAHMDEDPTSTLEQAFADPQLYPYVRDWGRAGDLGVVAVDAHDGRRLAAAWLRLMTHDRHAPAYVDDLTPELAIATRPECTGRGLGSALLDALLSRAVAAYPAIVLTVRAGNPALHLYRRRGFEVVAEVINRVGTRSYKMVRTLGTATRRSDAAS